MPKTTWIATIHPFTDTPKPVVTGPVLEECPRCTPTEAQQSDGAYPIRDYLTDYEVTYPRPFGRTATSRVCGTCINELRQGKAPRYT